MRKINHEKEFPVRTHLEIVNGQISVVLCLSSNLLLWFILRLGFLLSLRSRWLNIQQL
jgi:hypothetical protein